MTQSNLCSVSELALMLDAQDVRVLDASWYMPAAKVNVHQQFTQSRIPSAGFFDIDQICDLDSDLPHMVPTAAQFEQAVTQLGISNRDRVVIYDTAGLFSAARAWWMFKLFGHDQVQILDGGLPAWQEAEMLLESGEVGLRTAANHNEIVDDVSKPLRFIASINETFLADQDVLIENIDSGQFLVLDARSYGRFTGEQAEPRQGLESGHMPRSKSLPFDLLIDDGRLKPKSELVNIFTGLGLHHEQNQAVVTSCGSGVTAAIITLALAEAGFGMHKLYDGAWAEWASTPEAVILKGDA